MDKISIQNYIKRLDCNFDDAEQVEKMICGIAECGKKISKLLAMGSLNEELQNVELTTNVQGEDQKALDVLSNDIFLEVFNDNKSVCAMVSEEMDDAIKVENSNSPYMILFDPLDGSSNLEINSILGTIFSILKLPNGKTQYTDESDLLQPGKNQVGAGYLLYGPTTLLVVSFGNGVDCFTLDPNSGEFILSDSQFKVKEETQEFAINISNQRFWEKPTRVFIEDCLAGKTGIIGKDYNMRWVAAFVADIHRILKRSGVFMYPKDKKNPNSQGRLRLMYELAPMAYIVTQAGGLATTGRKRILDIEPTEIHQRAGIMVGSTQEVERIEKYYREYDLSGEADTEEDKEISPLFGNRTLFINNWRQ